MSNEDKLTPIIEEIGRSLNQASEEEKQFLKEVQAQIEEVAKNQGGDFDRRLEFCQSIIFNPTKFTNKRLIDAAKQYLKAVEKKA